MNFVRRTLRQSDALKKGFSFLKPPNPFSFRSPKVKVSKFRKIYLQAFNRKNKFRSINLLTLICKHFFHEIRNFLVFDSRKFHPRKFLLVKISSLKVIEKWGLLKALTTWSLLQSDAIKKTFFLSGGFQPFFQHRTSRTTNWR